MDTSILKKLKIVNIITETPDAKTFIVEPLEGWTPVYRSGQFITLVFYNHAGEQRRSFSLSSSPDVDPFLSFTVKKLDNGEFSRQLIYKAIIGTVLLSSGIGGFFVLPEITAGKIFCFLAAGSGITPCFALIKTLLTTTTEKVILLYSNRTEKETIFYDSLKQLQERYRERFTIYFKFSDHEAVLKRRLSHYVLSDFIENDLGAAKAHTNFYICGPFDYRVMADISLKSNGVLKKQIFKEDFFPFKHLLHPKPPDIAPHKVQLHIAENQYELTVQYPQTITASAKAAGITVPYSCESGQCGSCVATCTSGKIWMAYNEVLTDEEQAGGRVLTCQGYPVEGDATVVF
ncbi:MAG: iron-sulfur cluster-binding domain-containing protein [Niabella sp.]|nr:iron-sulfur cluster-binding domain-containing protein [Niabella sp.]